MASEALTQALAPASGTAVEQAEPRTPVALLQSDAALTMIAESLPKGMDAATFQRHAITLVKQTPKLMECEAASVAQGIVRGAALGLDPDPALGQMWLVPRNVKAYNPATRKDEWSSVATFQVGYRGLYELAMRTGRIAKIEVRAVHEHDHFRARLGTDGGLDHQPDWFGDRGQVIGWYAYCQQKDGTETFEVLSVAQAEAHRDSFGPKKRDGAVYGPWVDHFDAMAQKTVFIRLAKWLPKSVELARALEVDGTASRQPLGTPARTGDVIEATHTPLAEHLDGIGATAEQAAAIMATTDISPTEALAAMQALAEDAPTLPMADENGEPIEAGGGEVDPEAAHRNRKMWALVADAWPDEDQQSRDNRRKGLIAFIADGDTSSKDLDEGGWRDLFDSLELIKVGSHELHLDRNGAWKFQPKRTRTATAAPKSGPAHRTQA